MRYPPVTDFFPQKIFTDCLRTKVEKLSAKIAIFHLKTLFLGHFFNGLGGYLEFFPQVGISDTVREGVLTISGGPNYESVAGDIITINYQLPTL